MHRDLKSHNILIDRRYNAKVGRCRLHPGSPRFDRDWLQCLKLKYDGPLSNVAFNFKLRRCGKVTDFGCSKLRRALPTVMSADRVTVNWSAPEVLRGESDYTAGP